MSIPDDTPDLNPTGFNPDFASPYEWAEMYRKAGLQVIPSYLPGEIKGSFKRPLVSWADLQDALAPALTFERWYGTKGDHRDRVNMGILTGRCSGNVFVIDLDTHTHPEAGQWWQALLEKHAREGIITAVQKTGGGGIQMLFRAPVGWLVPTNKTSIGVDIRGQGGFAVMPPSKHERGVYDWLPGNEPWIVPIAEAPGWLIEAVMEVVSAYGGASISGRVRGERPEAPGSAYNEWGRQTDLREDKMFRMVFAVVVKWHRELSGVEPYPPDWEPKSRAEYAVYEAGVEPTVSDPGKSKTELLDMEERGWVEWHDKFKRCMNQWYGKIDEEAANPRGVNSPQLDPRAFEVAAQKAAATGKTFELFDVAQIKAWPAPKWVIDKLVIEQSLGFIFGPPGSLKTFIALDIALSLATGQGQWWGYTIEGAGAVLYISVEGNANLPFRIKAWEQHRKVSADAAPFYLIKQSINFLKAEDVGTLLATIEVAASRAKQPIRAIFVDTVSRVLPGAKENLQEDMTIFVNACTAVRERFGSVVFGVHHANAQGGIRGSTVIPAAGDFIIETRREPGALTGSIYAKKVKDGDDGWERFFEVRRLHMGDIKGTTSLAVEGVQEGPVKAQTSKWPEVDTLRKVLAALGEEWGKGKPWCYSKNTSRNATRNIMKRWRLEAKVVDDILAEWTANGIIAEEVRDAENHVKGYRKLNDI